MKKLFVLLSILLFTTTITFAGEMNTDAMLQYNQGIDYYKLGQYDQAVQSFRTAIKLDPNYIDAYYNLGSVLEYLQQYDAALAVFKQVIVRKPDDYDSVYKAAWLSYKLGEVQKAKTYLSIIPKTCARANDAQALAMQLNMVLPAENAQSTIPPTRTVSLQPKPSTNQSSGIYKDLSAPTGVTTDKDGNVYIAEYNSNTIVKITPDNKKMVYVKDSQINGPIGLALDNSKNLYIANYNKNNVLKVSNLGETSVLISNVQKPYYLYLEGNMLFISCQGSGSVLRYKLGN